MKGATAMRRSDYARFMQPLHRRLMADCKYYCFRAVFFVPEILVWLAMFTIVFFAAPIVAAFFL